MSSGNWYPRCAIDIRPSRLLFFASLLLAGLAVIAPWIAGLPAVYALSTSLLALPFSLPLFRWARGGLCEIAWQPDGRWVLTERGGRTHDDAGLLPGIYVGARMLVLHWRCRECRRGFRAVLVGDNCDADAFRRLVVRLRGTADAALFGDQSGASPGQ